MEGRRVSKPAKIILIVVLAVVVLFVAAGAVWWKTMSDLSRQSLAVYASELEKAAADSSFSRADLELMDQLRAIAASKESSTLGRSLCGGVGTTPLLRGYVLPEDRVDMVAVRDALAPKRGNLSLQEANVLWAANPRLQQTFLAYPSLVKQAMARRSVSGTRAGAGR